MHQRLTTAKALAEIGTQALAKILGEHSKMKGASDFPFSRKMDKKLRRDVRQLLRAKVTRGHT